MKKILSLILSASLLFITSCSKPEYINLMENVSGESVSISENSVDRDRAYCDFAVKVFKESINKEGKNTLISPLSIIYALGLTANGADGNTLSQMEEVFGTKIEDLNEYLYSYSKSKEGKTEAKLNLANSIWFIDDKNRLEVKESFLKTNATYYNAAANKADFKNPQTIDDINNWVKENTDGTIEKIINKIDVDSVMFLINALAFEAEWMEIYEKKSVKDGEFITEDGKKIETEFMKSGGEKYIYEENAEGFMKQYKGGYAFAALLPKEGMNIEEYVSSLSGEKISKILNGKYPPVSEYEVTASVSLPKFETEFELEMSDVFQNLGMKDAFNGEANFSKLDEKNPILISKILHKTYISVGEKGTKAGAATSVEFKDGAMESVVKKINLNRPFVYMIVDTTSNTPLFIGTMMNPSI